MGATKKAMYWKVWKEAEAQEKAQRLKDEEEERLLEEQIEEDIQRQEAKAG